MKNYGNASVSFSAERQFLMKERSQKVEGQGSALLSVSELQQFRACAMELTPVSPTRAGGRGSGALCRGAVGEA